MPVDDLSCAVTKIELFNGDILVSQGTGFLYARPVTEKQGVLHLITNIHVLTGNNPESNERPIGDNIKFEFHHDVTNPSLTKTIRLPLYTKSGRQLWYTHGKLRAADVAIIPLIPAMYQDCKVTCISTNWIGGDIMIRPTTPVTLIGYPHGFSDSVNKLPIYKTGNIASEPDVDFNGLPIVLVDVSAFPGMSGSPALVIAYGTYESRRGPTALGGIRSFMGIFASLQVLRENKYIEMIPGASQPGIRQETSLQLAYIWKARVIEEIIEQINLDEYVNVVLRDLI